MKIAMCGLDCAVCPAYIVHHTGDAALREKTAKQWTEEFKTDVTPEMIDCVGCLAAEGVHNGYCSACEIRKCGLSKGAENCGVCADFPCPVVSAFIEKVPAAKANLEAVRAGRRNAES